MPQEGIIKFNLQFTPAPSLPLDLVRELNAWRRILYLLRLIGQNPSRYGGFGYGNISCRLVPPVASAEGFSFVITGTQTGGLPELRAEHYVTVRECHPEQNMVVAEGPIRPSAESLTHGTLYRLDDSLRFVMHVHSREIWQNAKTLGIPSTSAGAAYGSPEMVAELHDLFGSSVVRRVRILAMDGHQDGLVSFGKTAEDAISPLITRLAASFQLAD